MSSAAAARMKDWHCDNDGYEINEFLDEPGAVVVVEFACTCVSGWRSLFICGGGAN